MARPRFQTRPIEKLSSITLTSDDDADIPATPAVQKRGRPRKGGPTLRPGIRSPPNLMTQIAQTSMTEQIRQANKRKGDEENAPNLRAGKRQKRPAPTSVPTGPASGTRARSRTTEPEARDGHDSVLTEAIGAVNAFSKPKGTGIGLRSQLQISLPTERQFLYEQNRAGEAESEQVGSSPTLERILRPAPEDDEMEDIHSMAVAPSGRSIKSKRLSSPVGITIRESPQPLNTIQESPEPLNEDVAIPSVESSLEEEDEQVYGGVIEVAAQEPVEQEAQEEEDDDQEEDYEDHQEKDDEDHQEKDYEDHQEEDYEEDQEEDPEEDKELPDANPGSPDLSSDPPPAQGLSIVYEIPDQESQVLLVPAPRAPKTINGLTAKRTKKGPTRVPKVTFSSPSRLRQFLDQDPSSSPLQPRAPRPTPSLAGRLSGGRLQPVQTFGSSPPKPTEDRFLHDDDLDRFMNLSETERGITKPAKSNSRTNGTSNQEDDPFADDPFADDPFADDPFADDPFADDPFADDPFPTPRAGGSRIPGGSRISGSSRISGPNDSLMIHAPSTLEIENTVTTTLTSHVIYRLHKLMGMIGWTELSKTWSTDLLQPDPFDLGSRATDTPAITIIGKQLFKYLVHLKSKFSKAPSDLNNQNDWLLANKDALSKATSEINKIVQKVCEDRLAVIGDSSRTSSNDLERRKALVRDMVLCVIPMLVQTLWDAFSLGGTDMDVDGILGLPVEGEFTSTTLQYLLRTTGWLTRLDRVVMFEMDQRPFQHYLIEGLSEREQLAYPEKSKKRRLMLGKLLKLWNDELKEAIDETDKKAEKEKLRTERLRREPLIKAWKIRKAKEEEENKRAQYIAFCQGTQRIRATLEKEQKSPTQRFQSSLEASQKSGRFFEEEEEEEEDSDTEEDDGGQPELVVGKKPLPPNGKPIPPYEEPLPPYKGVAYQQWDYDDSHFLLDDMREHERKGKKVTKQVYEDLAEALEKPLSEVMYEAAKLRFSARQLARQRGLKIEEWSRER